MSFRKSTRVYIAGPMTGYDDFNFPAFFEAQRKLENFGYTVYNPAEEDLKMGFDPKEPGADKDMEWLRRRAISHDLQLILWRVDVLYLLDGWEESKGVAVEVALARFLGLKIVTDNIADTFKLREGE